MARVTSWLSALADLLMTIDTFRLRYALECRRMRDLSPEDQIRYVKAMLARNQLAGSAALVAVRDYKPEPESEPEPEPEPPSLRIRARAVELPTDNRQTSEQKGDEDD